ncbi:MAG: hypothetical protein EA368_12850 [Leptolyngbya sp. DLM2.Bin27]|nr:MAG: hypothetical protein EA368_12850 [Leptolyngbya sp. DLM2.Bin27]
MNTEITIQDIEDEEYSVRYDAAIATVFFEGSLSLASLKDFVPISDLLEAALSNPAPRLILNLCQLEFLNSSGISVLSRFVIKARGQVDKILIVQGSEAIIWQKRSLRNLQRLMPAMELDWT